MDQPELSDLAGRIVYEDNHVLVINKRPGELSQGDKTGDPSLVDDLKALRIAREAKPGDAFIGLVHRLDRPTSGLLVCAKTSKALGRLNGSFQNRDVAKIYWAVVDGPPPGTGGELVHWLARNGKENRSRAYDSPGKDRQEARMTWALLGQTDRYWLLEVAIHTGRHHQIRAQLGALGLHIKGDLKYGAKRSNPDGGISLHACKLTIPHPITGEPLVLFADPAGVQKEVLWDQFPR